MWNYPLSIKNLAKPQSQCNGKNPSTPPRPQSERISNHLQRQGTVARESTHHLPETNAMQILTNSTFDEKLVGHDWDVSTIALGVDQRATDREIKLVKFQETLPKVSSTTSTLPLDSLKFSIFLLFIFFSFSFVASLGASRGVAEVREDREG